ncbi:hypothetical protein SLA2020_466010 [Shorea laevis]
MHPWTEGVYPPYSSVPVWHPRNLFFLNSVLSLNRILRLRKNHNCKLNEKEDNWTELRDLGDRALFVGADGSWSVSARDCAGCKGNCIYFSVIVKVGIGSLGITVFNLEDGMGLGVEWLPTLAVQRV